MQAATRIGIHRIFFARLIFISFAKVSRNSPQRAIVHRTLLNAITDDFMRMFETPTPKTSENIQKNVFSVVLTPD